MKRLALVCVLVAVAVALFAERRALRRAMQPPLPGWYENAHGWDEAVQRQRITQAPLLVYFHTSWCGWCKRLDRETLPDPTVERALRDTLKVRIDPEAGQAEREIADRLAVNSYPSLFVLTGADAPPVRVAARYAGASAEFARDLARAGAR